MNKFIFTTLLLIFVFSCGKNTETNSNKIRVAYHPNMGGTSTIITGFKQGYFKDEGLEIELVKFTSGPTEIAAMVSGDIQFAYIGHVAHSLAIQGKVNILFPNGLSKSEQIIAGKWAKINKISDLRGKTVGTQLGTSGDIVLDIALRRVGLTKNNINVVNMDVSGIVSSMNSKK